MELNASSKALILSGGGARGAYQVGVLKALASRPNTPRQPFNIISGTSVGALNASVLASHPDDFRAGVAHLETIWRDLTCAHVYRTERKVLLSNMSRWAGALGFGWAGATAPRSLLDNSPLRELIHQHVDFDTLNSIGKAESELRAFAITASSYSSGRAVSFFQGPQEIKDWERSRRRGTRTTLTADHVMASAALPLVFPAVQLDDVYFGDGALRENAPLSPAIKLGAQRVLSIAARDAKPDPDTQDSEAGPLPDHATTYPSVGEIAGHLLDILFNDNAQTDVESMARTNAVLHRLPDDLRAATGLRIIDHLNIQPSKDIRPLAGAHVDEMPTSMKTLLGTIGGIKAPWVLPSYIMFEAGYVGALIDLGEKDGQTNGAALGTFF